MKRIATVIALAALTLLGTTATAQAATDCGYTPDPSGEYSWQVAAWKTPCDEAHQVARLWIEVKAVDIRQPKATFGIWECFQGVQAFGRCHDGTDPQTQRLVWAVATGDGDVSHLRPDPVHPSLNAAWAARQAREAAAARYVNWHGGKNKRVRCYESTDDESDLGFAPEIAWDCYTTWRAPRALMKAQWLVFDDMTLFVFDWRRRIIPPPPQRLRHREAKAAVNKAMLRKYGRLWRDRTPYSTLRCPTRHSRVAFTCLASWAVGDLGVGTTLRVRLSLPRRSTANVRIRGHSVRVDEYCYWVTHPGNRKRCVTRHRVGPVRVRL